MEAQAQPTPEAPAAPAPTNAPAPIAIPKAYAFSPRADITALEAAHCGVLVSQAKAVVNLEDHPSWKWAGRHFEQVAMPVSVETQGYEQAAAAAEVAPPKSKGRRARQ